MRYKKYDPAYQKFLRKTVISNMLIVITAVFLIYLLIYVPLLLVNRSEKRWIPVEGRWYCEELQIQFSWEQEDECFAIIDEIKIPCIVNNRERSKYFSIRACPSDFEDIMPRGELVFSGEYVDLNNNEFIVMDRDTNQQVVFRRVP